MKYLLLKILPMPKKFQNYVLHFLFSCLYLSLSFFSASCSIYHIDSQEVTTTYYTRQKTSQEIVYLKTIDRPHEIIGTVTVNAERRQRINDVIEKMKSQAALIGGDAITDLKSDATGSWKKFPIQDFIGNAYLRANFTATVIAFETPETPQELDIGK